MQPAQHALAGFGVIVLDERHAAANGRFEQLLIKAFKEEPSFIAKDFGLDNFYVGDVSVDDVHVVLGNRKGNKELGVGVTYTLFLHSLFSIYLLADHLQQILPIGVFSQWHRQITHLFGADKALAISDLFRASDF